MRSTACTWVRILFWNKKCLKSGAETKWSLALWVFHSALCKFSSNNIHGTPLIFINIFGLKKKRFASLKILFRHYDLFSRKKFKFFFRKIYLFIISSCFRVLRVSFRIFFGTLNLLENFSIVSLHILKTLLFLTLGGRRLGLFPACFMCNEIDMFLSNVSMKNVLWYACNEIVVLIYREKRKSKKNNLPKGKSGKNLEQVEYLGYSVP